MAQEIQKSDRVKQFIRQSLGCDCDESVFEQIENDRGVKVGGARLANKINVGGRLLVYIVDAPDGIFISDHLPALLEAGRNERDRRQFNRFRIVIATDNPEGVRPVAEKIFDISPAVDEKVHLHVIDKPGVSGL